MPEDVDPRLQAPRMLLTPPPSTLGESIMDEQWQTLQECIDALETGPRALNDEVILLAQNGKIAAYELEHLGWSIWRGQ